jgi:pyruvate/2-oxoglutarate dehydrogenase complex dihydrolipoamide acyltransferase (E2) component
MPGLASLPGLLALSSSKSLPEELLLGLGEAAAAAAGDVSGFDPGQLLWSNLDSIADCVDAAAATAGPGATDASPAVASEQQTEQQQQQQQQQQQEAAAMDVDVAAADGTGNISSSSGGGGRGGVQGYLLAELGKMAVAPKEEAR